MLEDLNFEINAKLNEIIKRETLITGELKKLVQLCKNEKTEFPFGVLSILHYQEYAKEYNADIYSVAAAIELIILAFDIVDDIQDQDKENVWTIHPELSLNAMLTMLTLAVKLIQQTSFKHKEMAINNMTSSVLKSINGQHIDLLNDCKEEKSYLQMIEQKSGALATMSCLTGFMLATGKESDTIATYSKYIGTIQQIKNDIQSLKKWNNSNDLLNKKYTLPIIYLLTIKDAFNVQQYFQRSDAKINVSELEDDVKNSGAIEYALTIKNIYKNQVLQLLEGLSLQEQTKSYIKTLTK